MKDIKELALETLDAMAEDGLQVHNITYESGNTGVELDEPALDEFATRFLAAYLAEQEPVAWDGAEEWEQLAWNLCAEEGGEESCTELLWDGGPIPEPWGDRWLKYEGEAKRMISLVRKFTAPLEPAPKETALSMYKRFEVEYETADPVERLRAFCSFALDGQDWLDVEPFFDALTERLAARVPYERIATLEQQNADLVAALEKIAAMDYRKSAVNLFGRIAHEIVNVALSKVKQP